jgi:hypothetical protein
MYEKKDHYESWFVLIFYHKTENKARKTDPRGSKHRDRFSALQQECRMVKRGEKLETWPNTRCRGMTEKLSRWAKVSDRAPPRRRSGDLAEHQMPGDDKKVLPLPQRNAHREGGEKGCGSPHVSGCLRTTDESNQ